jgi:hypothetical protein
MASDQEKPWRRNVANDLVVNSIFAAISAIVVQTFITSDKIDYGVSWLIVAIISLFFFVISTEQLGESLREDDVWRYIRSSLFYNCAVLLLFLSVGHLLEGYAGLSAWAAILIFLLIALVWACFWGRDTLFLVHRNDHFLRWLAKIEGKEIDGEILDHWDRFRIRVRILRRRDWQ